MRRPSDCSMHGWASTIPVCWWTPYPCWSRTYFEHAFLPDYGLKRSEYVEAFFNLIDWKRFENRLAACLKGRPVSSLEKVVAS
ncbi:MAG: Fe-Mn family superoxide dismutase [Nitrospirota bacterium]